MYGYDFPLSGETRIPSDHGYLVLSSLSTQRPFLHGRREVQIAPLQGCPRTEDHQLLLGRHARLHVRGISPDEAIRMATMRLPLGTGAVWVGIPQIKPLPVNPSLVSRLVLFKQQNDSPAAFKERVLSRLAQLGSVEGVEIRLNPKPRYLKVKDYSFHGHSVELHGLSRELSEAVLQHGIGIKTSMGAGVFSPWQQGF